MLGEHSADDIEARLPEKYSPYTHQIAHKLWFKRIEHTDERSGELDGSRKHFVCVYVSKCLDW